MTIHSYGVLPYPGPGKARSSPLPPCIMMVTDQSCGHSLQGSLKANRKVEGKYTVITMGILQHRFLLNQLLAEMQVWMEVRECEVNKLLKGAVKGRRLFLREKWILVGIEIVIRV